MDAIKIKSGKDLCFVKSQNLKKQQQLFNEKLEILKKQYLKCWRFRIMQSNTDDGFVIGCYVMEDDGSYYFDGYWDALSIKKIGLLNCYRIILKLNGITPSC